MSASVPVPPRRVGSASLDEATFDAIVRAYAGPLCVYVATLVSSPAVAEDLVQELFTRIWLRGAAWDAADPVPYLFTAARNLARNHGRNEGVRGAFARAALQRSALEPAVAESPADAIERAELARAAIDAIASLPRQQRMAFTLSRQQGLTYAQIAHALDVSVKTVETQMGRALKALHRRLKPHVVSALLVAIPAAIVAHVMEMSA